MISVSVLKFRIRFSTDSCTCNRIELNICPEFQFSTLHTKNLNFIASPIDWSEPHQFFRWWWIRLFYLKVRYNWRLTGVYSCDWVAPIDTSTLKKPYYLDRPIIWMIACFTQTGYSTCSILMLVDNSSPPLDRICEDFVKDDVASKRNISTKISHLVEIE